MIHGERCIFCNADAQALANARENYRLIGQTEEFGSKPPGVCANAGKSGNAPCVYLSDGVLTNDAVQNRR